MARKRYSVEQIIGKLREAEKLEAQGYTVAQRCKRIGVSDQTFFRWRIKYGALKDDEAHRLKALEQENTRLKKIVAEQALDISMLKELSRGRMKVKLQGTPFLCAASVGAASRRRFAGMRSRLPPPSGARARIVPRGSGL